ncbi:MAG: thiamine pyrophosphate-dependent enzyme [Thermaerobacterales bacterium]
MSAVTEGPLVHPSSHGLRHDRLPHIWCPGCGLGVVASTFMRAVESSGIPRERHVVVSGIGCTGRTAGYLDLDGFHTTHGRALPFATGLKTADPNLQVTVISGDGDLFAIGGNHFIHAGRRNIDLRVICVNNFNYGMTGGQFGPTTPGGARTSTSPQGQQEPSFNLPYLAAAVGAVYVARWTVLHVRQLERAFRESFGRKGLTFIEVLSPCPVGYGKMNDLSEGIAEMNLYREQCVVDHAAPLEGLGIDLKHDSPIVLGTFVDRAAAAGQAPAGRGGR